MLFTRNPLLVKEWEKLYVVNMDQKKAGTVLLIADRVIWNKEYN